LRFNETRSGSIDLDQGFPIVGIRFAQGTLAKQKSCEDFVKSILNVSPIAALILSPFATQSWAAGSVTLPLNEQAACRGFECAASLYADVLHIGSAVAMNFTPIYFVLVGMALFVLRVVGKRMAGNK
jgi:hypothetical protein